MSWMCQRGLQICQMCTWSQWNLSNVPQSANWTSASTGCGWWSDSVDSNNVAGCNRFVHRLCALCRVPVQWLMGSDSEPAVKSPGDERSGGHIQLATLLEPWPTSLILLTWDEQTATPAPARQWDTEPTSSHLNSTHAHTNTQNQYITILEFRLSSLSGSGKTNYTWMNRFK